MTKTMKKNTKLDASRGGETDCFDARFSRDRCCAPRYLSVGTEALGPRIHARFHSKAKGFAQMSHILGCF